MDKERGYFWAINGHDNLPAISRILFIIISIKKSLWSVQ
jgi:hypothetical protein